MLGCLFVEPAYRPSPDLCMSASSHSRSCLVGTHALCHRAVGTLTCRSRRLLRQVFWTPRQPFPFSRSQHCHNRWTLTDQGTVYTIDVYKAPINHAPVPTQTRDHVVGSERFAVSIISLRRRLNFLLFFHR